MKRQLHLPLLGLALLLVLTACGRNMTEQPNLRAYESTPFFEDGAGMRLPPEHTVSREFGNIDPAFLTGVQADGSLVTELPVELNEALLVRGQQRFDIYCAVCHNYDGYGLGMAVQRGFPQPTSLHEDYLKEVPIGHFVQVMTNGIGRMYSYASRVPAGDRWAIAAYIRALQLSQDAETADLPADLAGGDN